MRLLLTVFAVACGVALVCAIDLVNQSVFTPSARSSTPWPDGPLSRSARAGAGSSPRRSRSAWPPFGASNSPCRVSASAFITDGSGELLTVHGVDITNDAAVRVYEPGRIPRGRARGPARVPDPGPLGDGHGRFALPATGSRRAMRSKPDPPPAGGASWSAGCSTRKASHACTAATSSSWTSQRPSGLHRTWAGQPGRRRREASADARARDRRRAIRAPPGARGRAAGSAQGESPGGHPISPDAAGGSSAFSDSRRHFSSPSIVWRRSSRRA